MSKILLNGVTYDGVQYIQVPTEEGGVATFYKDAGGVPSIDTLDETLLVADNIGKLFKSGGKLYIVQKTYKQMSTDAVAQITSLRGKTFVINPNIANASVSFASAVGLPGEFEGSAYIEGRNAGVLYIGYNDDEELECYFDGGPMDSNVGFERFDYEPINDMPNVIEWVKLNATFYENVLGFQQVAVGIPYETGILSVDLVVDENEGNFYSYHGELYRLTRLDGVLHFQLMIGKPWDTLYIEETGEYDVTNYAKVRVFII